jgi:hypothetical protein
MPPELPGRHIRQAQRWLLAAVPDAQSEDPFSVLIGVCCINLAVSPVG